MSRFSLFRGLSEGLYYSATFHLILVISLFLLISIFGNNPVYKPVHYIEFELGNGGATLGEPQTSPPEILSVEAPTLEKVSEPNSQDEKIEQEPDLAAVEVKTKTGAEKIVGYEEFKKQLFNPQKNKLTGLNGNADVDMGGGAIAACKPSELIYKIHSTPLKHNAFIGYRRYTDASNGFGSTTKTYMSIDVSNFSGELTLCSQESTDWQLTGNYSNLSKIKIINPYNSFVRVNANIPIERKMKDLSQIYESCYDYYERNKHEMSKSLYSDHGKCTQKTISTFGQLENEFRP